MKSIFTAIALAALPSMAQADCAPRAVTVHNLAEQKGQSRRVVALSADGLMAEMFASENGSWTLLGTNAEGISCVFGSGSNFEAVADPLPPMGEDS